MSLKFVVEFRGKRTSVNVTPMAPLQKIIEEVCVLQKPQLDVQGCRLYFQKKLLDPTTPVRFANLPKEAKLELMTDQAEQRLGLADSSTATTSASSTAAAAETSFENAAAAPVSAHPQPASDLASQPEPIDTVHAAGPAQSIVPSIENATDSAGIDHATEDSHSKHAANVSAAVAGRAMQGGSNSSTPPCNNGNVLQHTESNSVNPQPGKLDRQIHVFTRQAAAAAEASSRCETDVPEDFYDFTSDDYQKVMSGWARKNSQASAPLKTLKLREQEERKRAEQIGPVPVRVHLPDDNIIQAEFKALETLAAVHSLIQQCLDPGVPKWYMYVTPPKQILKDRSLTLYRAGLIPAANVLIGVEGEYKGPYLQSQITALQALPPARSIAKADADSSGSQARAAEVQNGSGSSFLPSSKPTGTGEKKVPKWMKLGK